MPGGPLFWCSILVRSVRFGGPFCGSILVPVVRFGAPFWTSSGFGGLRFWTSSGFRGLGFGPPLVLDLLWLPGARF